MLIYSPLLRYVEDKPLFEQYAFLARTYEQDSYCLDSQLCIAPTHINLPSKEVRKLIRWINKNIILGQWQYMRIQVLLRIATGMLNKLDISNDKKLEIHYNLVHNVNKEFGIIINDDLPF